MVVVFQASTTTTFLLDNISFYLVEKENGEVVVVVEIGDSLVLPIKSVSS